MYRRLFASTGLKDNHQKNNLAFVFSTAHRIERDYPNQESQKINKELSIKQILVSTVEPESFFQTDSFTLAHLGI